jgi:hypothetical protein
MAPNLVWLDCEPYKCPYRGQSNCLMYHNNYLRYVLSQQLNTWLMKVYTKCQVWEIVIKNFNVSAAYRLLGRCECTCVPFNCSRDRDRGLVRRELEATLWAGPTPLWAVYDARDIRSDAAAND